jgi:FdhE protein
MTCLWDERIARARRLALDNTTAREALTFYAALAEYQRSLFHTAGHLPAASDFAGALDVAAASAAVPGFLAWLEHAAPGPLAIAAGTMRTEQSDWSTVMRQCLMWGDLEPARPDAPLAAARAFVMDAVLQPYAEAVAIARREALGLQPDQSGRLPSRCPVCSGLPCLGILRPEGQGAKRMLLCGRCLTEWEYLRVVCASCTEETFDALPVYTADPFPHVRIEACDSCTRYLKTIDLTKDGHAVPVVDDIASLTLDLWANGQGYRRLRANLLRTADLL